MNYIILTGASQGIGLATARELLKQGAHVIALSRSANQSLIEFAKATDGRLNYTEFDLSKIDEIEDLFNNIFENIEPDKAQSIHLINNAGILEPVKLMQDIAPAEYNQNLSVNLIAPMALISEFLKHTKKLNIEKRIINISSGAAEHPYSGWAAYCTSKAGIDMLTRVVEIEQRQAEYPAKVLSFAPGVVATNMQQQIRGKSKNEFPRVERFKALKNNNQLLDPKVVGKRITELLAEDDFPTGAKMDIRK